MGSAEFVHKWAGNTRNERAALQDHFVDLCPMLSVKTPNKADSTGDWYAFQKGAGGDQPGRRLRRCAEDAAASPRCTRRAQGPHRDLVKILKADPDELDGVHGLATKNRMTQDSIGSVALQCVAHVCAVR